VKGDLKAAKGVARSRKGKLMRGREKLESLGVEERSIQLSKIQRELARPGEGRSEAPRL